MRINENHVIKDGTGTIIDGTTFDWKSSVFHGPNVFKINGWYFEFIADPSYTDPDEEHDFRVILDDEHYDYVSKNGDLNKILLAAYKSIKGAQDVRT